MGDAYREMAPPKTSLFGCCDNPGLCVKGWCCPGCIYGETDEIMAIGSCAMGCLKVHFCGICTVCCWAPGRRGELRGHLDMDEECGGDCVTWVCCPGLANCQERRELEMRNISNNEEYKSAASAGASGPSMSRIVAFPRAMTCFIEDVERLCFMLKV